jgi:hypothetical protein
VIGYRRRWLLALQKGCDPRAFLRRERSEPPDDQRLNDRFPVYWAVRAGNPDPDRISTSYIERQNLTMRMSMRRMTRLTNGYSKKVENLAAAVALHFMHYNFGRPHMSLGKNRTPAMAAGISEHVWTCEEIAGLLD